ncbi:2-dehydropantoate 2-reductase [Spongiibacter sp. KMU-158]|uniref:2-dehydropantoate 2-reductase n=1 Tax=Spongiibacter pelagi TaxID=2760804 RepID=A0A927GW17_9GAMM|nr:2-dehydropantoate 2-reductase [Spongiibacter pelagi]MBD2858663.1 2-dehydropantoate 2-reductase [Spongiibacter pelagi]
MTIKIGILGAGSVGCYLAGSLLNGARNAGRENVAVSLLGRAYMGEQLAAYGLTISDFRGLNRHFSGDQFDFSDDAEIMADADFLLVTVKSSASADLAQQIRPYLKPGAQVISIQNGVGNAEALAAALPGVDVLPGMIAFNVLQRGEGRFHAGTDGAVMVQRSAATQKLEKCFLGSGLRFELQDDMQAVLWSKLLLNLNNSINALAGVPLKEELSQRGYRQCLSLLQTEALRAISAAGIPLIQLSGVPAKMMPRLLKVPDFLFKLLAQKMLAIDPLARSSMWEDLERGRITEVDWLNGEVVKLAQKQGLDALANRRIIALIRAAEQGGRRDFSGPELLSLLKGRE